MKNITQQKELKKITKGLRISIQKYFEKTLELEKVRSILQFAKKKINNNKICAN